RPAASGKQARLVRHLDAVDPEPMHAAGLGGEPRRIAGEIEDPLLRPPTDGGGIEGEEIGGKSGRDAAAIADAENRCRPPGELPQRLFQREHAALAHPVAEEMETIAGIAEE